MKVGLIAKVTDKAMIWQHLSSTNNSMRVDTKRKEAFIANIV